MQPFVSHTGLVACMDRSSVDTDQIIPKQFLKRIERTGYGPFLFFDWRYFDDGKTPNPAFELNKPIAYMTAYAGVPVPVYKQGWTCHACGNVWEEQGGASS